MLLKFRANQLPVMLLGEVWFSIQLKCGSITFKSTFSLKKHTINDTNTTLINQDL